MKPDLCSTFQQPDFLGSLLFSSQNTLGLPGAFPLEEELGV